MTAEISSIFKTVLPLCPSCRAEISEDDSFCQECGSALSFADGEESAPRLAQLKMARLHPSLAKPVVTLPLIAMAVVGFVLVMVFLISFEKSYSGFSNHYVIEQAAQAYKENRFDEAATILERFSIAHKLDDQQRTLLSDVYLARAEQRVGRSDYVGAMSDLDKIPSQYAKFILVTGRKNELAELIKVQQTQAQAQALSVTKGRVKHERGQSALSAKSSVSSSTNTVLPAPSVISAAPQSELPHASTRAESKVMSAEPEQRPSGRVPSISPPESSVARAEPSQSRSESLRSESPAVLPNAASIRSELPGQKGLLKAKAARITESDQVRYNELLAGYFSHEHKQTSGASEPPSLKEWIDIGRPKF